MCNGGFLDSSLSLVIGVSVLGSIPPEMLNVVVIVVAVEGCTTVLLLLLLDEDVVVNVPS